MYAKVGWAMGRVRRSLNGSTAQFVRTNSQRSYQTTFYFETSQGKFSNPCWSEADIWRWFLLVWVTLRLLQRILAVTTWWRFVLRTSTAAIIPPSCNVIQCLGNGLSTSASKSSSSPASYPCHLLCLGIACSGFGDVRRRGAWWAHERCLFRSATVHPKVFQRPAIPKIDNNFLSLHLRFLPSQWSARPHALGTLPVGSRMPWDALWVHRDILRAWHGSTWQLVGL